RWTGTSLGATMPSRTLSPRISTTVTVMSLLITMLSFFFLDSTSIGAYPFLSPEAVRVFRPRQPRLPAAWRVPAGLARQSSRWGVPFALGGTGGPERLPSAYRNGSGGTDRRTLIRTGGCAADRGQRSSSSPDTAGSASRVKDQ